MFGLAIKRFMEFLRLNIVQKIRLENIKSLGKNGLVMIFILMFVVLLF